MAKAEEVVREELTKADVPIPKAQRYDLKTTSGELYNFFEFEFNLELREKVLGSPKKTLAATKGGRRPRAMLPVWQASSRWGMRMKTSSKPTAILSSTKNKKAVLDVTQKMTT